MFSEGISCSPLFEVNVTFVLEPLYSMCGIKTGNITLGADVAPNSPAPRNIWDVGKCVWLLFCHSSYGFRQILRSQGLIPDKTTFAAGSFSTKTSQLFRI